MSGSASPAISTRSAGSKPPAAVPVLGALSLVFAMLTLCAGGVRFVRPESALGTDIITPVFDIAAARTAFYLAVVVWMLLGAMLAVAGAGLVMGKRWGRTLSLAWAYADIGAVALLIFWNVAVVAPALEESHLNAIQILGTAASGPMTGCCPTIWAIVLLGALQHDAIVTWARASLPSISSASGGGTSSSRPSP